MKHISQKTTRSYNTFHFLPMNREVNPKHAEKMVESIRDMGCIRDIIVADTALIDGQKKKFIVDGQHLFTALVREGMPIRYREIEVKTEEDLVSSMASLNNTSKSWGLIDYVNAWKYVNPDYMKLIKYINLYNLEPTMIAMIGMEQYTSTGLSSIIKKGKFSMTNPIVQQMCKDFSDFFVKIGKADRWVKFNFLKVFGHVYGKYDHAKSLKNLDKHLSVIKSMSDNTHAQSFIKQKIFVK